MSIVFLRTITPHGPRTIVFTASDGDARLISGELCTQNPTDVPAMMILPDRPAYASVAQILAQRKCDDTRTVISARILRL